MALLYDIVKLPVYLAQTAYFKRIHVLNAHRVPSDKPVMLLPNHPNAFMDAIVTSVPLQQQINFLVRSDVFNSPVKKWLLKQLNNHPIYRIQEGAENLKKNEETFRLCGEMFRQNKTILIFPEGICVREKRVRRLKKGAARIAFGAEEKSNFDLDLQLIPVGVNYSDFGKVGGELIINYGEPVSVKSFQVLYQNEKAKAVNELTTALEDSLRALVMDIPEKDDKLFNDLETIRIRKNETGNEKFTRKKKLAERLKHFKAEPTVSDELKAKASTYFATLRTNGIKDDTVAGFDTLDSLEKPGYVLLSPLAAIGYVLHVFPIKLTSSLSSKTVGKEEFFDSVNMIGGMFIFLFWYFLFFILFSTVTGNSYIAILMAFLLPVAGKLYQIWKRLASKTARIRRFNSLPVSERNMLQTQRDELIQTLELA